PDGKDEIRAQLNEQDVIRTLSLAEDKRYQIDPFLAQVFISVKELIETRDITRESKILNDIQKAADYFQNRSQPVYDMLTALFVFLYCCIRANQNRKEWVADLNQKLSSGREYFFGNRTFMIQTVEKTQSSHEVDVINLENQIIVRIES